MCVSWRILAGFRAHSSFEVVAARARDSYNGPPWRGEKIFSRGARIVSRIKDILAADRVVRVASMSPFIGAALTEMLALHGGFDALWLDHEHGGVSLAAVEETARAAEAAGLDTFVRLAATDYATVMRFLEVGAGGVMAAQVRTADEVEQIVGWVKFPPRGRRGLNGGNRDGRYGLTPLAEYTAQANRDSFVAIQIENDEALANVEAIAAVPDVDLLLIGPADLSSFLGLTGQFDHPKMLAAYDRIADACASAGKHWGIVPIGPELTMRLVARGCRLLAVASDVGIIHLGIRAAKALAVEYLPAHEG
jgi:2-dehydro-3-deoxyglucarate aldolase/4-hydroxy-2-oxoheptanedioate aldolase